MSDLTPKPQRPIPSHVPTAQQVAGANLAASLKAMEDSWLMQLEVIDFQARMIRAKYDALIGKGFTHEDARLLCLQVWG